MENVYTICFYGGLCLTVLFLSISILLFVVLKIPRVMGEITGHSAKKIISKDTEEARSANMKQQTRSYNPHSGRIRVRESVSDKQKRERRNETTRLRKSDELINSNVEYAKKNTSELDTEETEILPDDFSSNIAITDVLKETNEGDITIVLTEMMTDELKSEVKVLYCAVVTHTKEYV